MSDIFAGLDDLDLANSTKNPKRLFRVLPKPTDSKFEFPHDIQTEVWDAWFKRADEPDLILKMNTGSGKTVIGLVILKSSLNAGKGPAVYLVPDKQLRSQVQATADELGIQWTSDPRDAEFLQSEAVLIVTVQAMYNGKSKFGVQGVGNGRHMNVGTIVVDDAHACIPIIQEEFSVTLERDSKPYKQLFNLFSDSLKSQSMAGHASIESDTNTHAVPVPYWDWQANIEKVFGILSAVKDDLDFDFSWPLIRDQLTLCDAAFTASELQIQLPYPNLAVVPSFTGASRRIYMTATLADDAVLVSQMGVAEKCVLNPITPESASDLGDRIILTPTETSRKVSVEDVMESASEWAKNENVVVIVPSKPRSVPWKKYTKEIHNKDTIEACLAKLTNGEKLGLVVLIARYDGVDLPNDACRILILDGLPERYSPLERVEAAVIGDTDAMNVRQTQRIEQGMGRGVRSTSDYCAVILLDQRLVSRLYGAAEREWLSPATRAQYELSSNFSRAGKGKDIEFFDEAIEQFLDRNPRWTNAAKKALENVAYTKVEKVNAVTTAERKAFEQALVGNTTDAYETLQKVFTEEKDARMRGWLKQRAAAYVNDKDPARAREVQKNARIDNNYILKTADAPSARITATVEQAVASSAFMTKQFASSTLLTVGIESMLRDLEPIPDGKSHNAFEAAIQQLGSVLGFVSSRPEQEFNNGPDNLWAIGGDKYWVIECKSETVVDEVSREYLEQLSHSIDWFQRDYSDARFESVPVMIHNSRTPMNNAVPRQGARAMTFVKLSEFRDAVRAFATAIAINDGYRDPATVKTNLTQFNLTSGALENKWTQKFKS